MSLPLTAALNEGQKALAGRLWCVRRQIRNAESKYADLDLHTRRDIHARGSKVRFLLAGVLQHRPSDQNFVARPTSNYDAQAGGPRELCPIIDIFEDVRAAYRALEEVVRYPASHSSNNISLMVSKAERVAWEVEVLTTAIEQGGVETPPLVVGTETFSEFCGRLHAYQVIVSSMNSGYPGQGHDGPGDSISLSSQQVIDNWNAVCCLLQTDVSLEKAIMEVQMATAGMEYEELAWKNQKREWFDYIPKLEALEHEV